MTECPKPKRRRLKKLRQKDIPLKSRRAVEERSGGRCEARLERCAGKATEIHHLKPRSLCGSHDPVNLLHVCSVPCHDAITNRKPGTERFRTRSWAQEGISEEETG